MLAQTRTAIIHGLEPISVDVEVKMLPGLPKFILIGLAGKALEEAKERVSAALITCGVRPRSRRTVVNLAPADIKKHSSTVELAIAVAVLQLYREIKLDTSQVMFFGELSLDGAIKPIRGALPLVLAARRLGIHQVVVPAANADELQLVSPTNVLLVSHLQQLVDHYQGGRSLPALTPGSKPPQPARPEHDLAQVVGQAAAKRGLEIAAAGGHHLLMVGPPGAGKTMLARAMPGILPPLSQAEQLDVTAVHSVAGVNRGRLVTTRPFRAPHHTVSKYGLLGGGANLRPGEITLAHRGVLFLDELAEYPRRVLESLRQPLEEGSINVVRLRGEASFPCQFSLVAAANPCPCGYLDDQHRPCKCTPTQLERYSNTFSGPLLDRIDLMFRVSAVPTSQLTNRQPAGESSFEVRTRVTAARQRQQNRYSVLSNQQAGGAARWTNATVPIDQLRRLCNIDTPALQHLATIASRWKLSARSYFRLLRVAQTICDLEGEPMVTKLHASEAFQYRWDWGGTSQ